jgi:transcriptional regulator of NAD metabolism
MKEKHYIKQLEDKAFELVQMLTDHSLYSFLSDRERKQVGQILRDISQAKNEYQTA